MVDIIIDEYESSTCHTCLKLCLDNCVFCDLCKTWLHTKCIKMTQSQFRKLGASPFPYFCQKCVSNALPLTHMTNFQLSNHLFTTTKKLKLCIKCNKSSSKDDMVYCISNKHHVHKSCSNFTKNDPVKSIWCCNLCHNFPFADLCPKNKIDNNILGRLRDLGFIFRNNNLVESTTICRKCFGGIHVVEKAKSL